VLLEILDGLSADTPANLSQMALHPRSVCVYQLILILLQQCIPPSVLYPSPAVFYRIEIRCTWWQFQYYASKTLQQQLGLSTVSWMPIHHNHNILQASICIQIGKIIVHGGIVCSLSFRSNIESEKLILV
jgi:hypothetical protein